MVIGNNCVNCFILDNKLIFCEHDMYNERIENDSYQSFLLCILLISIEQNINRI